MSTETTKTTFPAFAMKERGKLLVSPLLAAQITALHKDCGSNEWSGVLLFRTICEDIENPKNFKAVAEAVYPMNYGSGAYTEYDHDEDSLDIFSRYPKADPEDNKTPWKLGHIHTHHNMGAFFSGTDDGELRDNADKYPYYLSLVVDFKGTYKAKVAFIAETVKKISYKFRNKKRQINTLPEKMLVMFELDVDMLLDTWFFQRMEEIDVASKRTSYPRQYSSTPTSSHSHRFEPGRTNSVIKHPSSDFMNTGRSTLWPVVRDKMPFLFFEKEEHAKSHKFYWMFAKLASFNNLKTREQQEKFMEAVMEKIDKWLDEHFKDYLTNGGIFMEERIIRACHDQLDTHKNEKEPLSQVAEKYFRDYISLNYEVSHNSKKDVNKESEITPGHHNIKDPREVVDDDEIYLNGQI